MGAKKIIITSDGRKKSDIKIGAAGTLSFNKETIVINNEDSANCKATKMFLMKVKAGNPDAEIVVE